MKIAPFRKPITTEIGLEHTVGPRKRTLFCICICIIYFSLNGQRYELLWNIFSNIYAYFELNNLLYIFYSIFFSKNSFWKLGQTLYLLMNYRKWSILLGKLDFDQLNMFKFSAKSYWYAWLHYAFVLSC